MYVSLTAVALCILYMSGKSYAVKEHTVKIIGHILIPNVNNTLICVSTHKEGYPEVFWTRSDNPDVHLKGVMRQFKSPRGYETRLYYKYLPDMLYFLRVKLIYYCNAIYNKIQKTTRFTATVTYLPQYDGARTLVLANPGDNITINCTLYHNEGETFFNWIHNNVEMESQVNLLNLSLFEDEFFGRYDCREITDYGVQKPRYFYVVNAEKVHADVYYEWENALLGQDVVMDCCVKMCYKETKFQWQFEKKFLNEKDQKLSLILSEDSFGNYTCWVIDDLNVTHIIQYWLGQGMLKVTTHSEKTDIRFLLILLLLIPIGCLFFYIKKRPKKEQKSENMEKKPSIKLWADRSVNPDGNTPIKLWTDKSVNPDENSSTKPKADTTAMTDKPTSETKGNESENLVKSLSVKSLTDTDGMLDEKPTPEINENPSDNLVKNLSAHELENEIGKHDEDISKI